MRGVPVSPTPVTITAMSLNGAKGTAAVTVGAPGAITTITNSAIITGVATGATDPRCRVTATTSGWGNAFGTITAPVTIATVVYADSATFANNAEFGRPTAASPSNLNDLLITRTTDTLSCNASHHGTPNWVSDEVDSRLRATEQDRCNCFTADPMLTADQQILTSDYTNGGCDRGHMTRSADRVPPRRAPPNPTRARCRLDGSGTGLPFRAGIFTIAATTLGRPHS